MDVKETMIENGDRLSDSADELDISSENENTSPFKKSLKNLEYYSCNALYQAFNALDETKKDCLPKTKIHLFCANICNVFEIKYVSEKLNNFDNNSTNLSFDQFLGYVNKNLLSEVPDGKSIDTEKIDSFCWVLFSKERRKDNNKKNVFEDSELFQLWQAFNRLNIKHFFAIDIDEASLFIEDIITAIGTTFANTALLEYANDRKELNFWDFIDCIETCYIKNTPKSVYKEGLEAVFNKYIQEILKTGCLVKKGHRVKSMKERWFVLLPTLLRYHEHKNIASKLKGVIIVNKDARVKSLEDTKSYKCRFTITCGKTGTVYEMEASTQKIKNEWITAIQQCIDCFGEGTTPLTTELLKRYHNRVEKRRKETMDEEKRKEQEAIIQKQLEELEKIRLARDEAQMQAENESMRLEEERKQKEELEKIKLEYEKLLEDERKAREEENNILLRQKQVLEEETLKRITLEKIKEEQEAILQQERQLREGLEEESKKQAQVLEQERERLNELEKSREKAEKEMREARDKLQCIEEERQQAAQKVEEAKKRAREMKLPVGLAKPLSQWNPSNMVTHRGAGAFVEEDFSKKPQYLAANAAPVVNQSEIPSEEERTEIIESSLVKPSVSKQQFEPSEKDVNYTII